MTNAEATMTPTLANSEDRNWAVLAHLASLVNLLGIPSPLGPLVVWMIKKNDSPFAAQEAKSSLNFALSVWIYSAAFLVLAILGFVGSIETGFTLSLLCLFAWLGLILCSLIFSIIGAVKASSGESYHYPFMLELVK
jgi:uncharacterized Tic20 family protein